MLKNLVLISQEKMQSSGKERFMEDTDFLIPWSPQEIFNIEGKSHISKISTSLRILEQRGYIKRHRNSPKGPVAYISFTNDGIFIAKTCYVNIVFFLMHLYLKDKFIYFKDYKIKCSIGKMGLTKKKAEGDLKTPRGTFNFRYLNKRISTNVSRWKILDYI